MGARRSIEAGSQAWTLEQCSPEAVSDLGVALGIEVEGKGGRRRLRERLADDAFVASQLRSRTPFELVLLETLVDFGGMAEVEDVWGEACRRLNIDREFHDCELTAARGVLGCALRDARNHEVEFVSLYEPCYGPMRRLLGGVSIPAPAGELPQEAHRATQMRTLLAAAARTVQRRVSATKTGTPNGSNRRKFEADAAAVGVELWEQLALAIRTGLCRPDVSRRFFPDRAAMRAAAEAGCIHPTDPDLGRKIAGALADGPQPVEAVVRALAREELRHRVQRKRTGFVVVGDEFGSPWFGDALRRTHGVWTGEIAGIEVATIARPSGDTQSHVLPNFDVMLGPETPLPLFADVALIAELRRLDVVATFRLTPESIRAAIVYGLSPEDVMTVLAQIGERELPANVAHAVREWGGSVATARIVRRRVVVLPDAAAKRLLADPDAAGAFEELAAGIVAVAPGVSEPQLAKFLSAAGVEPERGTHARPAAAGPPVDELTIDRPDPQLHARVQKAAAARDFPELRHDHDDDGDDDDALGALGRLAVEIKQVVGALTRWRSKLPVRARAKVSLDALIGTPELAALLATIEPVERARILRRSTKVPQIRRRAQAALAAGKVLDLDATFDGLGSDAIDDEDDDTNFAAPTPADFPSMTPRDVREAIDCAAGKPSRVYLLKRGGNRTEVPPALRIRVVEPRGSDLVVLADAVDGDEAFAFSLHSIASVLVEGSRGIDDEIAAILGMRPRRGTHRPSARGR